MVRPIRHAHLPPGESPSHHFFDSLIGHPRPEPAVTDRGRAPRPRTGEGPRRRDLRRCTGSRQGVVGGTAAGYLARRTPVRLGEGTAMDSADDEMRRWILERLPEGCRLTEKLGSVGWYISTWRARDPLDRDVVLRVHCTVVSDDYPSFHDLRDQIAPLCPGLERLVRAPATPGLAPWLGYTYHPDKAYLVLVRTYYDTRLAERFSSPNVAGDRPAPELVAAFWPLAEGVDALCQQPGQDPAIAIHEGNLFLDGSRAVLEDFGCWDLERVIEDGYAGPRPANGREW